VVKVSEELKKEVMQDVLSFIPDVYRYFWNFQEVADFVLISYVVAGRVDDFKTYQELKSFIVSFLKENLKNYKNGGIK